MTNFALIGVAGYIAPKHMKAIFDIGGNLLAALDKNDSVGILDSYFTQTQFFTEFERFDRFIEKCQREKKSTIDYISICSPNYLHDSHIRFALKNGTHAICEKPLVLNPHNLIPLKKVERDTGKKIFCILQLRLYPSIIQLKKDVDQALKLNPNKVFDIDLTYLTSRGPWYFTSWKGDVSKSGGITTNIGVHFFDMLIWIFGPVQNSEVHILNKDTGAGFLQLKHANVKWFLSIKSDYLSKKSTFRSIVVDKKEIEFSKGFEDLHTKSYQEILNGDGFGLDDVSESIELVSNIRNSPMIKDPEKRHSFCSKVDHD
ncbi:MAG: oxidoreductase [Candidatus Cloacimonadota bacterium]|nr:MAG: oxidoreductase [Candidatus Cloacimonadota bacterium]